MPIELSDNRIPSAPVLRHQVIGEIACVSLIRFEQRDRLRKNPATNQMEKIQNGIRQDGSPKYRQELVVHGVAMDGTTMQCKIGDDMHTPAAGERVRLILKGKSFGNWIEAVKQHRTAHGKLAVGDLVYLETTHAQAYDQDGNPKGQEIRDQVQVAAIPRGVTVGFYGTLQLAPAASPQWQEHCEELYHQDEASKARQHAQPLDDNFDDYAPQESAAPPVRPMAPPPMAPPPMAPPSAPPVRPMAPPPMAAPPRSF
jgi:hypothetical protein